MINLSNRPRRAADSNRIYPFLRKLAGACATDPGQIRATPAQHLRGPAITALSLNEAGHPIHAKITAVSGFSSQAIAAWARRHLAPGSHMLSDGLAFICAVTAANCHNKADVTGGKHPRDLPQFCWINTLLGNLKTSFSGTFHAFKFDKHARRFVAFWAPSVMASIVASTWNR